MRPEDISSSFSFGKNGFKISGVPLERILHSTETPVYVYDAATIARQYGKLRKGLPKEVDILYSVKANPHPAIVRLLGNLGAGAEIASEGELAICEVAGISPYNIVFAGPGKTRKEIFDAIKMRIYSINAESQSQLEKISSIATEMSTTARVALRINPKFQVKGAIVTMGGAPKQFGVDEEKMRELVETATSLPYIELHGIHIFSATNIMDEKGFLANVENCFALAKKLDGIYPVTTIDFGLGAGIPYEEGERELSTRGLGEKIKELMEKYRVKNANQLRIIAETGRYLVGQSGIYVARVSEVKESRGKKFAIIEGGINHFVRPALMGAVHPVFNLSKPYERDNENFDVAGWLCTPKDILAGNILLPKSTNEGDCLGIFCTGAYGRSMSPLEFLSHEEPPEVLVNDRKYAIITHPESIAERIKRKCSIPDELR